MHITGEKTEGLLNQEERRWVICIETSRRIVIPIFSNGLTLPRRRGGKSGFPGRELNRRREDESDEDVFFFFKAQTNNRHLYKRRNGCIIVTKGHVKVNQRGVTKTWLTIPLS